MPRKLEAGLAKTYSMPVERITSTIKSEPARPPNGDASFGTSVSIAICCALGRSADGILAAPTGGVAASATSGGEATGVAAPATATPARNFRRLTSGRGSFRAIWFLPLQVTPGGLTPLGPADSVASADIILRAGGCEGHRRRFG